MNFRVFSEGQGTEWRIFFGLQNLKYLFGVLQLQIPDIFFWLTVDAGPEPTYEEKMRVPPPPLGFVHQFKPIPVKCI